ncbi:MAG: hypothetical protein PF482_06575 [Desulfobacteraceae bacterium]|jgi:hypothetical protein|nr:hypothetical protein [Desulfobacteraceae bacterium]
MSNSFFRGKKEYKKSYFSLTHIILFIIVLLLIYNPFGNAFAQTDESLWYRLRTNNVPYQPENIALDGQGGLWINAIDGTEYEPGVWYMSPDVPEGAFQYITDTARNNNLGSNINMVIKPQLDASVVYAVKDGSGNKWYSLKDKGVICEKTDDTWVTFNQQNTDDKVQDYVHRIRLMGGGNGSQIISLISYNPHALTGTTKDESNEW